MNSTAKIVCLANSRKYAGRCVAGKQWDGSCCGQWIRPVSTRGRGELTAERWYEKTWRDPLLLDIIEMGLLEHHPAGWQTENYLVDTHRRWRQLGHIASTQLVNAIDHICGPLWANGDSSRHGCNDKVRGGIAFRQDHSLALIQPELLSIEVTREDSGPGVFRHRIRGRFNLGGSDYALIVTDPIIEKQFKNRAAGDGVDLCHPILCVSLSEKVEGQDACYKLIASVISIS